MNAKVAAAGIFVIVGLAGSRMVVFMKDADRQINSQAYEDGFYEMDEEETQVTEPLDLPGLPPGLQASLDIILDKDASTLKAWLTQYRPYIKDPKLSEIELAYVVKVGRTDPPEARKVFAQVAGRNGPNSPLRPKIDRLAKTYQ